LRFWIRVICALKVWSVVSFIIYRFWFFAASFTRRVFRSVSWTSFFSICRFWLSYFSLSWIILLSRSFILSLKSLTSDLYFFRFFLWSFFNYSISFVNFTFSSLCFFMMLSNSDKLLSFSLICSEWVCSFV
jgi:hypothetical protein